MNLPQQKCPACDEPVFRDDEICAACEWPLDDLMWPRSSRGETPTLTDVPSFCPTEPKNQITSASEPDAVDLRVDNESVQRSPQLEAEAPYSTVRNSSEFSSVSMTPPTELPTLAVSYGHGLTAGSKQVLQCRVTNSGNESISYWLNAESRELGVLCRFHGELGSLEATTHHQSYEPQHHGTFHVSYVVEIDGRGVLRGTSTVYISDGGAQPVINVAQTSDAKMNAGSMTSNIHLNLPEAESGDFKSVELQWRRSLKFTRSESLGFGDALTLRVFGKGVTENVCLFAKGGVTFGKSRSSDVTLRLIPETDDNEQVWGRVSRLHARCQRTATGVEWQNLNCTNGTQIDGMYRGQQESQLIRNHMKIVPAGAISLTCSVFELPQQFERSLYEGFRADLSVPSATSNDWLGTVRLGREGKIAGQESYVLCPQACLIGSASDCAVVVDAPKVARHHAIIVFLGGSYWLEPLDTVFVRGARVEQHELVLLGPDTGEIVVGDASVRVSTLSQLSLDIPV